jgi:hypothetical protein
MSDEPQHIDRVRARGGSTNHVTRYVLGISLVLAVIALALVLAYWA